MTTTTLADRMLASLVWHRRMINEVECALACAGFRDFNPPLGFWGHTSISREKDGRAILRIHHKLHGDESLKDRTVVDFVAEMEKVGSVTTEDVADREEGAVRVFRLPLGVVHFQDEKEPRSLDLEYRVSVAGSKWCAMVTRIECFAPSPEEQSDAVA